MSNWGYVTLAYGLSWLVLGGYALYLLHVARRAGAALREAEAEEAEHAAVRRPRALEAAR